MAVALPKSRPYQNSSTLDLVNSMAVFQMCAIPPLVDSVPAFIKFAKLTRTEPVLHAIVKNTFFKHFCGTSNLI